MRITLEELEKNVDYYLEKSTEEDVYVTKDGVDIAVFVSPETYSRIKPR